MHARAHSRRRFDSPRVLSEDAWVIQARVREAADRFLERAPAARPWRKIELATWLVEDYARACVTVPARQVVRRHARVSSIDRKVVAELVEEALGLVRTHAAGLRRMGLRTPWLKPLLDQGVVVALRDPRGQLVFAPTTMDGLRLYERALSLKVADFLNERLAENSDELVRFLGRGSGVFPRARVDEEVQRGGEPVDGG